MGIENNITKSESCVFFWTWVFRMFLSFDAKIHEKYTMWSNEGTLRVLMPKYMKSTLCGITREHYEKRVLWVLLSFLDAKNKTKNIWKELYIEKQNNITKNVYFECFHIVSYQNDKRHAKTSSIVNWNENLKNMTSECLWVW